MDEVSEELFGGSFSVEVLDERINEDQAAWLNAFFGHHVDPVRLGSMVGAPSGSRVRITLQDNPRKIDVRVSGGVGGVELERSFEVWDEGVVVSHDSIWVRTTGRRIGTRVVARSIRQYTLEELHGVIADAKGGPESTTLFGYFIWPAMGFNMPLREETRDDAELEGFLAEDTHQLMQYAGGLDWWREHGHEGLAHFDLFPASLHNELLAEYLEKRNVQVD